MWGFFQISGGFFRFQWFLLFGFDRNRTFRYSGCMEQRTVREILDVLDVSAAYVGVIADEVPGAFALGVYQDLCDDLSELRSAYELERRAAGRLPPAHPI